MKDICLGLPRQRQTRKHDRGRATRDVRHMFLIRRPSSRQWVSGWWRSASACGNRLDLYWKNGKIATRDGPYAETMEQLGGILVLKAGDLNHAVQFMAQHPALKYGSIRGSASAGLERNDEAARAAAARGYLAMRAATTEASTGGVADKI
jgi:hypothetical protein